VPPPGELGTQRDRGEGVPGVAEGSQQEATTFPAQSISASSRTIRLLCSRSNETMLTINVPTPAPR
jgi:hypothetical protein